MKRLTVGWWVVAGLWELLLLASAGARDPHELGSLWMALLFATILYFFIWANQRMMDPVPPPEEK